MADRTKGVPVYLRVGDGEESEIGTIDVPDGLPHLLRTAADYVEASGAPNKAAGEPG